MGSFDLFVDILHVQALLSSGESVVCVSIDIVWNL